MHLEPPLFVHVLVLVVCICHHHRSSQACSLIEKKSLVAYKKKKKRAYLRLKTLTYLEAPLFVQVLVLVVCVHHRCHISHTYSLVVKKIVSRAKKVEKKKKNLPEARDTDTSQAPPVCPCVGIGGVYLLSPS